MATLEKIRTRAGLFISIIIGLSLILFIVDADTLQSSIAMFSSKYSAGKIKGKKISQQEYFTRVDRITQDYKLTNGEQVTEETTDQIRTEAWNELFREIVMFPEFEKVGIDVSPEEMNELVFGQNPSDVIVNNFTNPQTGVLDRDFLIQFVSNVDADPTGRAAKQWDQIEESIKLQQLSRKYTTLITKATVLNDVEIKDMEEENAVNVTFDYVSFPYELTDSTINVSNSDLKAYYTDHKKEYKRSASRDIEYVAFPIDPSEIDYQQAKEILENTAEELARATDVKAFVIRNSDKNFDANYYKKGELPSVLDDFAFSADPSDVLPVYQEGMSFKTARIADVRNLPDSVNARHILIRGENPIVAHMLADSLIGLLNKGANFAALANEYSEDTYANQDGGSLGWFTYPTMVHPFNDSCFFGPKGKFMKVDTQFGTHIVQVTERGKESRKVQLGVVEKDVVAGKATYQGIFAQATDFASKSKDGLDAFNKTVSNNGLRKQLAANVFEQAKSFNNLVSAREIVRWAYDQNQGAISDVFDVDNQYFVVAALTVVREDGIPELDQIKPEVEMAVRKQKSAIALIEQIKNANATSLTDLGTKVNKQVEHIDNPVNFSSFMISGTIGVDAKMIGAVSSTPENIYSGPVEGAAGVYMYTVTSRTVNEDLMTPEQIKAMSQNNATLKGNAAIDVLYNSADIKDYRARFF